MPNIGSYISITPLWPHLLSASAGAASSATAVVLTPRYVVGLLAFLICVDMTQVLGVLCYQLFLGTYFPWHLYPLMLNRAIELLALLCSDGHVPTVYSVAQVFLSVLSMVICIQKQPCGKFNCIAALVLYGVLLTYQIFVAVMVIKIASIPIIGEHEGNGTADWLHEIEGQRLSNGPLLPSNNTHKDSEHLKDYNGNEIILAVEQPDGEKYAIARLLKEISFISEEQLDEGPSQSTLNDKDTLSRKINEEVVSCKSGELNSTERAYAIASSLEKPSKFHDNSSTKDLALIEDASHQINTPLAPAPCGSFTSTQDADIMERSFLTNLTSEIVSLVRDSSKVERVER